MCEKRDKALAPLGDFLSSDPWDPSPSSCVGTEVLCGLLLGRLGDKPQLVQAHPPSWGTNDARSASGCPACLGLMHTLVPPLRAPQNKPCVPNIPAVPALGHGFKHIDS